MAGSTRLRRKNGKRTTAAKKVVPSSIIPIKLSSIIVHSESNEVIQKQPASAPSLLIHHNSASGNIRSHWAPRFLHHNNGNRTGSMNLNFPSPFSPGSLISSSSEKIRSHISDQEDFPSLLSTTTSTMINKGNLPSDVSSKKSPVSSSAEGGHAVPSQFGQARFSRKAFLDIVHAADDASSVISNGRPFSSLQDQHHRLNDYLHLTKMVSSGTDSAQHVESTLADEANNVNIVFPSTFDRSAWPAIVDHHHHYSTSDRHLASSVLVKPASVYKPANNSFATKTATKKRNKKGRKRNKKWQQDQPEKSSPSSFIQFDDFGVFAFNNDDTSNDEDMENERTESVTTTAGGDDENEFVDVVRHAFDDGWPPGRSFLSTLKFSSASGKSCDGQQQKQLLKYSEVCLLAAEYEESTTKYEQLCSRVESINNTLFELSSRLSEMIILNEADLYQKGQQVLRQEIRDANWFETVIQYFTAHDRLENMYDRLMEWNRNQLKYGGVFEPPIVHIRPVVCSPPLRREELYWISNADGLNEKDSMTIAERRRAELIEKLPSMKNFAAAKIFIPRTASSDSLSTESGVKTGAGRPPADEVMKSRMKKGRWVKLLEDSQLIPRQTASDFDRNHAELSSSVETEPDANISSSSSSDLSFQLSFPASDCNIVESGMDDEESSMEVTTLEKLKPEIEIDGKRHQLVFGYKTANLDKYYDKSELKYDCSMTGGIISHYVQPLPLPMPTTASNYRINADHGHDGDAQERFLSKTNSPGCSSSSISGSSLSSFDNNSDQLSHSDQREGKWDWFTAFSIARNYCWITATAMSPLIPYYAAPHLTHVPTVDGSVSPSLSFPSSCSSSSASLSSLSRHSPAMINYDSTAAFIQSAAQNSNNNHHRHRQRRQSHRSSQKGQHFSLSSKKTKFVYRGAAGGNNNRNYRFRSDAAATTTTTVKEQQQQNNCSSTSSIMVADSNSYGRNVSMISNDERKPQLVDYGKKKVTNEYSDSTSSDDKLSTGSSSGKFLFSSRRRRPSIFVPQWALKA